MKKDCIVIGMSNFGMNIAIELNKNGKDVTVIDKNADTFNMMDNFSGFMVSGDATDLSLLEENGINNADMVVITTDSDNLNIFLAHVCSQIYHVPNIFCRIVDTDKNILIKDSTVKVINPFSLCMEYFRTISSQQNNSKEGNK